ncbi:hypothetical protein BU17DRAFT_36870 [Hysterangium stoloniferum]|nr:hypothetical protein BU17DRAFT_36870 [Hysterangium stoloniferum]
MRSIVRDVVERQSNSASSPLQSKIVVNPNVSSVSGFPVVEHRSKHTSAFKRSRQDERVQAGLNVSRDKMARESHYDDHSKISQGSNKKAHTLEELMSEISRSNAEILENMSEDQRLRERQEIFDHFGTDVGGLMQKVRKAREKRTIDKPATGQRFYAIDSFCLTFLPVEASKATITESTSESSLPSRTGRKIRFVDPTDADVHVYESQPSSPRRVMALLPPPDDSMPREDVKFLGNMKVAPSPSEYVPGSSSHENTLPDDGTPEDIRRRFFPSEAPAENNASLAWMLSSPPSSSLSRLSDGSDPLPPHETLKDENRYSLSGVKLSLSQVRDLPTHLGLHHHASTLPASSDSPAGYTLQDLLLLARSSVPAQRASILGVLAKILKISYKEYFSDDSSKSASNIVNLDAMRRDMLDAAIDALGEKGGVGQRAIDVLWEAVVGYTQAALNIDNLDNLPPIASVSEELSQSMAVLAYLPLDRMLPAMQTHLILYSSPVSLTHMQVLDILLVLSYFEKHARMIVDLEAGNGMINAVLTSHFQSSTESDELQAMLASIRILQILAQSGRQVAQALLGPADVLLKYVMTPLPSIDVPEWQNGLALIQETLTFYTLLARYGLYAHVATTAQSHFTQIADWLSSNLIDVPGQSILSLAKAYIGLLEAWIVCSTDPHRTTPPHDILWSQVQGWAWVEWILDLSEKLGTPASRHPHEGILFTTGLWASICHAIAAWVESASINGIRGGEDEKALVLSRLGRVFRGEDGLGARIDLTIKTLKQWRPASAGSSSVLLKSFADLSADAKFMAGVGRLSLAFFNHPREYPLGLPSKEIRDLCRYFTSDDGPPGLFEAITGSGDVETMPQQFHAFVRPVSIMLGLELLLWHRSMTLKEMDDNFGESGSWKEAWTAQTLQVLPIFQPGEELLVKRLLECLCSVADPVFIQNILHSVDTPNNWKCNMETLLPFFTETLFPHPTDVNDMSQQHRSYISSFWPVPESISACSAIMPPSLSCLRDSWKSYDTKFVLPIRNSWPTWPLNHLLHSGSSSAFQNLPIGWDATESDVVRLSLLLTSLCQEINSRQDSRRALLSQISRPEAIFACMEVFMLENGQQQLDSSEEIFRDSFINHCMDNLLLPFTFGHPRGQLQSLPISDAPLEYHSRGLLGSATPFFQFYTDFVALYDAISFSHSLFARLLLPPIDMTYAMDYRKLLFGDYSHVLRTIKTRPDEVFSNDLRGYLWPIETNAHMLGWYLKALLAPSVEGFIRWLALHHIAGNIWTDIDHDHPTNVPRATKLLSALATQGDDETIRDVALYTQSKTTTCLPPKCFEGRSTAASRLDQLVHVEDHRVREMLRALFVQ